jgi:multiple antibiotic resistance protein
MSEPTFFFLTSFVTLFAIIDAIGNAPIFLSITPDLNPRERNSAATRGSVAVFVILSCFALLGNRIFHFFGITIDAFRIAGGLILLKIAMDMLEARTTRTKYTEEDREGPEREDVAIIPLAMPMLSGPGAISSVIVLADQTKTALMMAVLIGAILANAVVVLVVLRGAAGIVAYLKGSGMRLLTRILGILLASIAVQYILTGLIHAFSIQS